MANILDLRGIHCPMNFVKAKLFLEYFEEGETVELLLDDGEPVKNVPRALKDEGHRLLGLRETDGYYTLSVEKAD